MVFGEPVLRLRKEPVVSQAEVLRRNTSVYVLRIAASDRDAAITISRNPGGAGRNVRGGNPGSERSRNDARRCDRANLAWIDRSTCSDQPAAVCADVTDFSNHPPRQLALHGEVPLLRVRSNKVTHRKETESAKWPTTRTVENRSSIREERSQPRYNCNRRQREIRV